MASESIAPSFLLLIAGLMTFLLSTQQFKLWIRALIWLFGFALLGAGYYMLPEAAALSSRVRLLGLLADALLHRDFTHSAFANALGGNWLVVDGNLAPMFDILVVLTLPIAIVALLAFTPGEWLEKMIRPIILALLGAIVGGFIALSLVAVGLGGYAKNRVYAGAVNASAVVDGDTFSMGDVSLRLDGVDAPERHQICHTGPTTAAPCGQAARLKLIELVQNAIVVCGAPLGQDAAARTRPLRETFGRPIVHCDVYRNGVRHDLAEQLLQSGAVALYRDGDGVRSPYPATSERFALGCTVTPHAWRDDPDARAKIASPDYAFNGVQGIPANELIGC